ncbi:edc3f25d-fd62-424b-906a-97614a550504-CDS [Sclerotinia trifoliorum]|uniref:Edc3f25d-fd62-424b-906a-97614a550504-CDS n=1 Tax=Sclerotinia trifoliorum TaxID=28548 RepID=A0A8H2VSG4_9HELO|nr:edc3f25d-fd62-424b-906a-97614a550504-CDS [Sclerotinia trifoliorum]
MDMDDPWGSPWADELNNDDGLGIRSTDEAAVGNRVAKASEALRNNINTSWGTSDDGFGDWKDDRGKRKGGLGLGLDGAEEQWITPKRGMGLEVRKDDSGALSPAWDNFSTSPAPEVPKLSPSLIAKPAAIAREPSPDPWANAASPDASAIVEDEVSLEATTPNPETTEETIEEPAKEDPEERSLEAVEATVPQSESGGETKVEPAEPALDETVPEVTAGLDEASEKEVGLGIGGISENDLCAEDADDEEQHKSDVTVLPSTQEPEHESSRPSSSPSDTDNHDELLPDSARTSLDEEPKRSRNIRAVSPSAQEVVEQFDGLAESEDKSAVEDVKLPEKASAEPDDEDVAVIKPENSEDDELQEDSNAEEPDDDEFGDFGDFEEGLSDDGEELVKNHDSMKAPISSELATPHNEPSEIRSQERPSGPVDFSINLSSVKTLFGETEEKNDEAVEKIFIPDTLIADTFASADERKMWYRISRYGTMRKYNTGDDENYVRISWAQSKVKLDTQKIVARWMEEDRNSGHVSLGGTGKGGSLFGWNDPNAPPVPLATVLGSKRKSLKLGAKHEAKELVEVPKKLARDRSRSKSRSSSKPRENSSTKSMDSGIDVKAPPQSPAVQFGWNSSPTAQTASTSDRLPSSTDTFTKPLPLRMNSAFGDSRQSDSPLRSPAPMSPIEPHPNFLQAVKKPRPISMPPPFKSSSGTISLAAVSNASDGDDDEWGEMVSSPVVTETPKFHTRGLRHKKSLSLGNSFPNPIILPNPQVTKLQSEFGHKSTTSLGDTLGNPKSPTVSQPPLSSGTSISSPISSNPSFVDLWSTPESTPLPIQSTAIHPPSPALSASAISNLSPQPTSPLSSNTTFTDTWSQPPPNISSASGSPTTTTWSQPSLSSIPPAPKIIQDPWASVDFSFFDTPTSAPATTSTFLSKPITNQRPQSYAAPPMPKSVTFSTPSPTNRRSLPPPVYTGHGSKTKFEMEQDEIVKRIVGGLPDLGYMLRR